MPRANKTMDVLARRRRMRFNQIAAEGRVSWVRGTPLQRWRRIPQVDVPSKANPCAKNCHRLYYLSLKINNLSEIKLLLRWVAAVFNVVFEFGLGAASAQSGDNPVVELWIINEWWSSFLLQSLPFFYLKGDHVSFGIDWKNGFQISLTGVEPCGQVSNTDHAIRISENLRVLQRNL